MQTDTTQPPILDPGQPTTRKQRVASHTKAEHTCEDPLEQDRENRELRPYPDDPEGDADQEGVAEGTRNRNPHGFVKDGRHERHGHHDHEGSHDRPFLHQLKRACGVQRSLIHSFIHSSWGGVRANALAERLHID